MRDIRAFVGHSFTEDDSAIVRAFLTYFDQLSKWEPDFSWQHAESAEPRELADKVKSLISDKNVFIGICTKKERVVSDSSLKRAYLPATFLKAAESKFLWKTSDWIIQEIGLAVGRDLDLILLIEEGVRTPGGLQGNVEYISFSRNSPERSFGKIVEMLNALTPKASTPTMRESETRSLPAEDDSEIESALNDMWEVPKPEWNRINYEFAYMHMTATDNASGASRIGEAYLETEEAAQNDHRVGWEAFCVYTRLTLGRYGSIVALKEMSERYPNNVEVLTYLARTYAHFQEYEKAANTFELASGKCVNSSEKLRLLGESAANYTQANLKERAIQIVNEIKRDVQGDEANTRDLLSSLLRISDAAHYAEDSIAIMECILAFDPSDSDTRFSLAYKHDEAGNNDLALYHYLKIPVRQRSAATWNNLGVGFDHFSLSAKSVDAYRNAIEMGETLAMSNLAEKYISAGFLPEARKQCEVALAVSDYHKNVGRTLAKLQGLPDKESEKQTELLRKAKPKSDFYREFGRALSRPNLDNLADRWKGPDCILEVKLLAEKFSAAGAYEQPSSALLGALLMGTNPAVSDTPARMHITYTGTLRGHAIHAHVTRGRQGEKPVRQSLLGSSADDKKVLMYFTDDMREICVMEAVSGGEPLFYSLHCLSADIDKHT